MLPRVRLTSPPPPLDLVRLFPGIEAYARTATRLHPRPGVPSVSGSHVGGMLLWPKDEPWPTCPGPHLIRTEIAVPPQFAAALMMPSPEVLAALDQQVPGFTGIRTTEAGTVLLGTEVVSEPTASPLVPVAQLHAADVPDLRCPTGADVLQVLWCPNEHPSDIPSGPPVLLKWRTASSVVDPLDAPPAPVVVSDEGYLPRPCVLHPEQITEYPWWQELPEELARRVRAFDDTRRFGEHGLFLGLAGAGMEGRRLPELGGQRSDSVGLPALPPIDATTADAGPGRIRRRRRLAPGRGVPPAALAHRPGLEGRLRAHRHFRRPPTPHLRLPDVPGHPHSTKPPIATAGATAVTGGSDGLETALDDFDAPLGCLCLNG